MSTIRLYSRVVCFAGAALLIQISPARAEDHRDHNRPVDVAFTKWVTTFPLMEGYWGGDLANKFVGEVLQRQVSVNPALNSIVRLEAIYEFQNGDRSFTALIRGGTNNVTSSARPTGVILAGARTRGRLPGE